MEKGSSSVMVWGARGYSGQELVRLLKVHPKVSEVLAVQNERDLPLFLGEGAPVRILKADVAALHEASTAKKVAFLATPAEVSLELAPKLLETKWQVIDLSGAFRLKTDVTVQYEKWYSIKNTLPKYNELAHYGLVPLAKPAIQAPLISNPGCYATAVSLALGPLLKIQSLDISNIIVDAKSGTTGAGRKASESLLAAEVAGDCKPYRIGRHQHTPEILQTLKLKDSSVGLHFTTTLLECRRGILASCYIKTKSSDQVTLGEIKAAYQNSYSGYALLRHAPLESTLGAEIASLRSVVGTAYTHLAYTVNNGMVSVFALIDNLMKGAASQAIENWNISNDLPPETGLSGRVSLA